jgi:hypothetical protein
MAFVFPTLDKFPPDTEFWVIEGDPKAFAPTGVFGVNVRGEVVELRDRPWPDETAPWTKLVEFDDWLVVVEDALSTDAARRAARAT